MVNWDDSLDKRLLLTIIAVAAPSAIDYKKVAALMGDEYTSGSVQQRYTKKLKKEAEEKFGALGAAGEGEAAAKTHPKKKTPAKKAAGEKRGTDKRKAVKKASEDEEGEKDDEESPSKKVKMERKEESEDEDEL
ncbi:hypothetical protein DOTSEDRAFT_35483 [Dothistroma septosporum NZE10]|uniref:Uncharacterized protein n=1 Tax=Dothistroma septosporum (strain NZE10 / CBS 128990) TaxID=675120 RepID=M2Y4E8_DOTSN|nr:hypothetical protein DOTSEDRAFT_35483 [Dothistroma septosporum NZE10]